jgi:hypothetical protein
MESSNGSEGTTLRLSMSIRSLPDRIAFNGQRFDQPNNAYGYSVTMVKQGLAYGRRQQVRLLYLEPFEGCSTMRQDVTHV